MTGQQQLKVTKNLKMNPTTIQNPFKRRWALTIALKRVKYLIRYIEIKLSTRNMRKMEFLRCYVCKSE